MKKIQTKRFLSLLIALALTVSLLSGLSLTVFADTLTGTPTGYTSASQVVYDDSGSYLKNWGARGEACVFLTTYAQNYYTGGYTYANLSANSGSSSSSGYTSSALFNALHSMLEAKQTTVTSYAGTTGMYRYTDCVNNNYNYISSFYSAARVNGTWDSGATWNREHTWPNSKIDGNGENDIMMLRPTAVSENSSRGNKAYGLGDGYFDPNTYAGSLGLDLRGDCARIMLYVYVRWSENASSMWGVDGVIQSVDVLLDWMEADPVDTWEMGRNDVVQSITGVRNCFVDYPELAWLLFGRSIPSNYTSPSGGSAAAYTVTAVSNNTNYGTVSVNGYTITAAPKTGYYAAGYTVTSGSASVVQNGNSFIVTPASDCTVRINFAPKTTVTVTCMANGSLYSTLSGYAGEALTLPALASPVTGWSFEGWSETVVPETNVKPAFLAPGAAYTPVASVTLYAVYSRSEGGSAPSDDYARFTGTLEEGSYLVVYDGKAMKAVISSNRLGYGTVTPVNDVITTDDASLVWELSSETVGGTAYWRFRSADTGTYAAATSTNNRATLLSDVTDYARWSVTAGSGSYDFQNKQTGRWLRNNGSYGFAAYATSTGGPLTLYKNVAGSAAAYTTEPAGTEYTVSFSVLGDTTVIAPMTISSLTGAVLPTAEAPEGYEFLGWVTEDYDNVSQMPAPILTGLYRPQADITLKALYSYEDDSPKLNLMTVNDTFSDGDKVVIVDSTDSYGLYQQTSTVNTGYTSYFDFTNDAADILADARKYFDVTQVDGGWWLGDETNGWLYTPDNTTRLSVRNNTAFMTAFELTTYEGYLALQHTVSYNTNLFYLNCCTSTNGNLKNLWCMVNSTSMSGTSTLHIYKLDEGGTAVTYYTTLIDLPHEHTPAEAVIENNVDPTCTAAGSYDSVVYCAECGEELSRETVSVPALGHDYVAVVTEATCTVPGYTTYTCSRCGDSYTGDETAALGHLPGEPVQENYVEPAIGVEGGYDTVICCQRCGEELSREHTVLPALPNPEPIETTALRIYSSISVGTDMVVTWTARKTDVANYEKFWIEVVKHGAEGDESYLYGDEQEEALDESTSTWQVNFKHIFAKEMGVEIEARVYAEDANGQIYMSPAKSTNIRDYLGGRLTLTNNTVEQRVLAADMLNYGAAAQLFGNYNTEHLVNEELTAEQLAKLDEYETKELPAVEKANSNYRPEGQSNILFNSVSLDNEVILSLTVRAAEGADVKVLMKDHESGTVLETLDTVWNGSNYVVDYSGIGADKMRVAYDFVARIDGAETGNVRTWSVEGYVGELRSGNNQLQINVANALLTYGDSAAAYFAAQ